MKLEIEQLTSGDFNNFNSLLGQLYFCKQTSSVFKYILPLHGARTSLQDSHSSAQCPHSSMEAMTHATWEAIVAGEGNLRDWSKLFSAHFDAQNYLQTKCFN